MAAKRATFGGKIAVILALVGSAIGLGNIWRFPYIMGEGGGGAFILVYIIFSICLSVPIFMSESIIGRRSGANCLGAMKKLAPGTKWKVLGYLSIITPLIIVSYYSVVGGWSLEYLIQSLSLAFVRETPDEAAGMFSSFSSGVWAPTICFLSFQAATCLIVALGVNKGIEIFSKIAIPVLFVTMILVVIFSVTLPGAGEGIKYLLTPDLTKITPRVCASALGQSFYSLSLGMGIVITYSSYMPKEDNILSTGISTAIADTCFALLAGFAIMPAVFAAGIAPSGGPGLVFQTLPYIFTVEATARPVLSSAAAIFFFVSVLFAAMTSSVSLVEVGTAFLVEEKGMKRKWATLLIFVCTGIVGVFCSLSMGPLAHVHFFGKPLFDFLDMFCSNILLILGGLLTVVFVGWKMSHTDFLDELTSGGLHKGNTKYFRLLHFIIKYVAPIALGIIFISNFI